MQIPPPPEQDKGAADSHPVPGKKFPDAVVLVKKYV